MLWNEEQAAERYKEIVHLHREDEGLAACWIADLVVTQELEHSQRELDEMKVDRLLGRCDVCKEWPDHMLTIDGGEALCDGCHDV